MLEEAISLPDTGMIISYHPPIFKPLPSLTLSNPLQKTLLTCASLGISVYSPHTSVDAVKGGVNDWLAAGVLGEHFTSYDGINISGLLGMLSSNLSGTVHAISEDQPEAGGRIVKLNEGEGLSLPTLIDRIKKHLGLQYGKHALRLSV